MVDTIAAVRGARNVREAHGLAAFSVGSLLGGAAVIGALGLLREPAVPWAPSAIGGLIALSLGAAAIEAGLIRIPSFPARQVPASWRPRFGGTRALALYGLVLGAGVFTFITHATLLVALGVALLVGPAGLLVGIAYGASKAIAVSVASAFGASFDPARSASILGLAPAVRVINATYLTTVAVSLIAWRLRLMPGT